MDNAGNPIQRLYSGFVRAVSSLQSPFLLLVRLYWGWQISQNGWGKLHNLPHVTEFFASLGLPAPAFTAAFVLLCALHALLFAAALRLPRSLDGAKEQGHEKTPDVSDPALL